MLSLLLRTPGKEIQSAEAHELLSHWLEDQNPPLRLATKRHYLILWGRFVKWVEGQGYTLNQITDTHVIRFLSSLDQANRPHRERYRLIIYRAFSAVQEKANPAEHSVVKDVLATSWRGAASNDSKQFLTRQEQALLIQRLEQELGALQKERENGTHTPSFWKRERNGAIVALLLGCGLKPLEVLAMRCDALFYDTEGDAFLDTGRLVEFTQDQELALVRTNPKTSTIHAYIHDFGGKSRVLEVPNWCTQWLEFWLVERGKLTHDVLFPANQHVAVAGLMNPATLTRTITNWGELNGLKLSAQKLRNSFGSKLIDQDKSIIQISHQMGFVVSAGGASKLISEWNRFNLNEEQEAEQTLELDLEDLL